MTTDEALDARFGPVYERIAAGALEREAQRRLPFQEVEWLRAAGFGRIRVPEEDGGLGATLTQLFRQLIALGRADSNLPQLLRGHIGFVESRLGHADPDNRKRWLRRIVDGALVGNAQSEESSPSFWQNATTVRRVDGGWRLDGRKFYSTGSLFADWILTTATVDGDHSAIVLVPATAPGVRRLDDWDGFGQRLTGSGTTVFEDVPIADEDVEPYENGAPRPSSQAAIYQLVHLATLAGIGQAAVADAVAYVAQRTRNLANPAHPRPRLDPQVQQVVGRVQSKSFAATATTLAAVGVLERGAGDAADAAVFAAQAAVIELVLGLTTELFEVGGASAVTERFRLDRHWRNARTLASHNPVITRQTVLGDHLLNGTSPSTWVRRTWEAVRETRERGQSSS
ncbi:MAG TPA: acyl-CoA dehydrogenase family protein [Pseudonocardia sp.]|jgi:alkylation response protein AidB-like acyl-CoA dehydrogenase|uniref:acyl-CoA dehydrogenase family protein n=1 Tax=Pseudonocardia sp. TaxID=60912 RepID=UPI002B4B0A62|nr:acyl-CoA dehydrogenase family protein [Pseudonocardia sp.]HLU59372.1 acyl-CoA dehydrogenase family protein [Pseudonocardia sp.]